MMYPLKFLIKSDQFHRFLIAGIVSLCFQTFSYSQDYQLISSKDEVEVGETFQIQLVLKNFEPTQIKMPDFGLMQVVGGPQKSNSISIINGARSSSQTIGYILKATQKGNFTIPPATMKYQGKTLTTNSLKVKVSEAKPSAEKKINSNDKTIISIETNVKDAYIHQQIELNVVIYTRQNISRYELMDQLSFDGFYVVPIENIQEMPGNVQINGKEYYRQTIQKYLLFPQKSGNFTLGPVNCKIGIATDSGFGGFFGDISFENIHSNSLYLSVLPLPSGAPTTFSGAVGKFQIDEAKVSKNTVGTGEAFHYQLSISGDGDPKVITIPSLDVSSNLEAYPPSQIKDYVSVNNDRQTLQKTFEYTFVPKKDTVFTIVPEFSYFNTEDKKYVTLKKDTIKVFATPSNAATEPKSPSEEISAPKSDIIGKSISEPLWNSRLWYMLIGLFLVLGLVGIVIKRKSIQNKELKLMHQNTPEYKSKMLLSKAKKHLDAQEYDAFYDSVHKAIHDFILQKYHIQISDSELNKIKEVLLKGGIPDDTVLLYADLTNQINQARFAGQKYKTQDIYNMAVEVLNQLDSKS